MMCAVSQGCRNFVSCVMRRAFPLRKEAPDVESRGHLVYAKGAQHTMQTNVLSVGSLVDVTSYSPFRGLRGTIQVVNTIADESEEPFCFYLVSLEGTHIHEPVWFENHEVEEIEVMASPLVNLQQNA